MPNKWKEGRFQGWREKYYTMNDASRAKYRRNAKRKPKKFSRGFFGVKVLGFHI